MFVLSGILVVVVGFAIRLNPLLVVTAAALVAGVASGRDLESVIALFGKAFNDDRYVGLIWLVLPVVGLLERAGLQERARAVIGRFRAATAGRLLLAYFMLRQGTAALGLTAIGGHAQMVRPLIAPMAEAAALRDNPQLPDEQRQRVRAHAAASDNIALFFGEDIFIAIASILLIQGVLEQNGIKLAPFDLSVWAIPTAIAALAIHGIRLIMLDLSLRPGAGLNARKSEMDA